MVEPLALSDSTTITVSVVGFFVFLVLIALMRAVLRRDSPQYRRYRLGIFVERDGESEPRDRRSEPPPPPSS